VNRELNGGADSSLGGFAFGLTTARLAASALDPRLWQFGLYWWRGFQRR
jgi:hypothetical protein